MKLGVVTTSYPRFPGDPAGNFVAGHVAALRALGHTVEVIAAGGPATATALGEQSTAAADGERRRETAGGERLTETALGEQLTEMAAAVTTSGERPTADASDVLRVGGSRLFYRGGAPDAIERTPIGAIADGALFTARLTAAVMARAAAWDGAIAHWLVPSAMAALACGKPLVAIAHGGDVFTLRRLGLLGPVLRALRRRHARLVLVSEPLRAIAREAAPGLAGWLDGAVVQPMGIDVARFAALARAPSDPPIVLVAARLVPVKGVDVAIAAMAQVRRPAQLVIAGDGPERARLAAGPHRWLGEVTTERRDELLRAASVVVVPSRVLPSGRTEGTPAIALEALAAGVPVVASSVGGLRDVPGVRLVPPENPSELARAIEHVLAQPPPAEALRSAVANLDWREIAPRLLRE